MLLFGLLRTNLYQVNAFGEEGEQEKFHSSIEVKNQWETVKFPTVWKGRVFAVTGKLSACDRLLAFRNNKWVEI